MNAPPQGVKARITVKGHNWDFDCIGGTGEPIYFRVNAQGERRHLILVGVYPQTKVNP